jgi:hypothetical protein
LSVCFVFSCLLIKNDPLNVGQMPFQQSVNVCKQK